MLEKYEIQQHFVGKFSGSLFKISKGSKGTHQKSVFEKINCPSMIPRGRQEPTAFQPGK